jgi:hypothetical protein
VLAVLVRVYKLHHSIGYTLLLPTLLVGVAIIPYSRFWPPDVLCWGSPLMSSLLEGWPLTNLTIHYPFDSERSLDVLSPQRLAANSTSRHLVTCRLFTHGYCGSICVAAISLLRKHNSIRCIDVGIRNQLLHSSVNNRLPSRCLGSVNPKYRGICHNIVI